MIVLLALLLACRDAPPAPEAAPPPSADGPVAPAGGEDDAQGSVEAQQEPHTFVGAHRPDRAAARHILITYSGNPAALPETTRSEQQARKLAEELHQRLVAGEDFAALARRYSDDSSGARGGDLGPFDRGRMVPEFEQAVFALDPQFGLSGVVESPFGYHLIQRYPLEEIRVAHVLVQYAGLARTASDRPQEEARLRAEQARARLLAGEEHATVASELSDGPSGVRGGELGWFQRGQMLPQFDKAAFSLAPGQVSEVIESPLGYHVILRLE